ncbi:hypothetical protein GCM10010449_69230 [Streptomyces rectiviolaceus]|uniref:Transposase n=1 Tax=Streptomyces rectiviolaceus TaxID=332591 RepID=A0ABP6N897_9ACTN
MVPYPKRRGAKRVKGAKGDEASVPVGGTLRAVVCAREGFLRSGVSVM